MKILLTTINSKYIHLNLALRYLYEYANEYKKYIEIKEFTINNEYDYIFSEILRNDYDVICFSTYIWNVTDIKNIIKDIKKVKPNTLIILGGPEVSFESEEFLEANEAVDIIIRSEGELIFKNLMHALINKKIDLSEVKGITYRKNNSIISNENEVLLQNLDDIPFPYNEYYPENGKIIYYETSRGCPFNCSYCMSSTLKGVRNFSLDRVKKDLKFLLSKNVPQVKLIDRTFNTDFKRCVEMMEFIIANDNGITNFHFEVCGDLINQEFLDAAKKSRKELFQLEIGVQSTNKDTLNAIGRKMNIEKLEYNVKKIMSFDNMHVHLDLIAGLPFETLDIFEKSFNEVYDQNPHHLQLGFLKILKGSKIKSQQEEHTYNYREKEPYEIIYNKYMTAEDLIKLKEVENIIEKYYNKPGFRNSLEYLIEKTKLNPFQFYSSFADYWYENGYQHISHKKDAQYKILKSYIESIGLLDEIAEEILTYDAILVTRPNKADKYLIKEDKLVNEYVHKMLHDEETIKKHFTKYIGVKAKEIRKKIGFQVFEYDIVESTKLGNDKITKEKNLCIVDYGNQNVFGEANTVSIKFEEILKSEEIN